MFDGFKDIIISFINAPYIQNLSALIQAFTAVGVAIYGLFSFNKWAKEKYLEKRSDYAEESLTYLESAHEEIVHLLRDPKDEHWNERYAHAVDDFKRGRRKANRIGDPKINGVLKRYEETVGMIEANHIQRVDDMFMGKDKAIADERLSHSIDHLQKLYSLLHESLTEKTLVNANHF